MNYKITGALAGVSLICGIITTIYPNGITGIQSFYFVFGSCMIGLIFGAIADGVNKND